MDHIDFTGAVLQECDFKGVGLENVTFPEDSDHIVIRNFPRVLRMARHAISSWPRKWKERVELWLEILAESYPNMDIVFLWRKDLIRRPGDEVPINRFVALLKRIDLLL